MSRDYTLPSAVSFTVDDLAILPDECRYELIDGRLDLSDRQPLPELAGLALMAELRAACVPGFRGAGDCGASLTVFRATEDGGFRVASSTHDVFVSESPYHVRIDLRRLSRRWPETFEYIGRSRGEADSE